MKDLFYPIRFLYRQVLDDNISINGKSVPFYDVLPKNPVYPHIVVRQQNSVPVNTKRGCEQYDAFIMLEIVTQYPHTLGGRKDADLIADQMFALLDPKLPPLPGFSIGLCYLDSDFDQGRELTKTDTINRRFIQFKNSVSIIS